MISLIIAFYKRLDFLELIFQSLDKQSYKSFEVILAEDDNDPQTIEFVGKARLIHKFNLQHVTQEHIGFRKTRILNSAIKTAKGEQIVFIDGDCIVHKQFLKEYSIAITEGYFCYGRRVFCSARFTDILLKSKSIQRLNILLAFFYGCKSIESGFYYPIKIHKDKQDRQIEGCNWGVLKKNIEAVNGFDEDYNRATVGEDLDIDWRLKKQGLKVRSMKGKAIVFHLYHKINYSSLDTSYLMGLMKEKKIVGNQVCVNGITKANISNKNY